MPSFNRQGCLLAFILICLCHRSISDAPPAGTPAATPAGNTTAPAGGAGKEHGDKLPPQALGICNATKVEFCVKNGPEKDETCTQFATTAGGSDAKCDADNGCSFQLKLVGANDTKLVYISHKKKIDACPPDSVTYKTCGNGLIIYGLYPA